MRARPPTRRHVGTETESLLEQSQEQVLGGMNSVGFYAIIDRTGIEAHGGPMGRGEYPPRFSGEREAGGGETQISTAERGGGGDVI